MGKTIIISSHILTELSDLCSSVAILERGKLLGCGNVDLLSRKQWSAARVRVTLHAPHPGIESILGGNGTIRRVEVEGPEVRFEYSGAPEDFHKVLKLLTDAEIPVLSVEHDARDLENLFLELTRGDVQ